MKYIGHRCLGRGNKDYPENSIIALEEAINLSLDGVEFDVELKDGELYVYHSGNYQNTNHSDSDSPGQGILAYEQIPKLKEFLGHVCDSNMKLNIELKGDGESDVGTRVAELIENEFSSLKDQIIISSFSECFIADFSSINGMEDVETALLVARDYSRLPAQVESTKIKALHLLHGQLNLDVIGTADTNENKIRLWDIYEGKEILLNQVLVLLYNSLKDSGANSAVFAGLATLLSSKIDNDTLEILDGSDPDDSIYVPENNFAGLKEKVGENTRISIPVNQFTLDTYVVVKELGKKLSVQGDKTLVDTLILLYEAFSANYPSPQLMSDLAEIVKENEVGIISGVVTDNVTGILNKKDS